METMKPPSLSTSVRPNAVYRCNQCGIESLESSCFVGVSRKGPQRFAVTCITCSQPTEPNGALPMFFGVLGAALLPILFLVGFRDRHSRMGFVGIVIAACLIQPILVLWHELGHFFSARLLGLEATLIILGTGPKVWSGKILGVPLRIHGWPTMGLTYLGARSMQWLRLRVWITVLMGPATNLLLIGAAMVLWNRLALVVDTNITILSILYNALLVAFSLLPHRVRRADRVYHSDGLQLLQIPFKKSADLAIYLAASAIASSSVLFNDADYAGARDVAVKGLERLPGNLWLSIMLSACQTSLGEYDAARTVLEPFLDSPVAEAAELRAVIANNLAIAVWLRDLGTAQSNESTARADALSERAFRMYPCILPYRSTRALILTATHRSEEALALLQYANYERGSAADRADRQAARAFALRELNRYEDAEHAIAVALRLVKTRGHMMAKLGLLAPASHV
jgi:tetratricopeptide (TPR) repeat protein